MEIKSLRSGNSVANRRVVEAKTAAQQPAPAADELGWHFQGADWLHVYIEYLTGATAASVVPWFWSDICEQWFAGDALAFTSTDKFAAVEVRGEHKVYFQVSSITGGGGTVNLWAGFSFDGRAE